MLKSILKQPGNQLNENLLSQNRQLRADICDTKLLLGKLLANDLKKSGFLKTLHDAEFKVFSQWGDDGIIQYLANHLDLPVKKFVEFGVENYIEANTR